MRHELLAFTLDRAETLSGLTRGQLDYCTRTGLVIATTSPRGRSGTGAVTLLGYEAMLHLLLVVELRRLHVPTRTQHRAVTRMRTVPTPELVSQVGIRRASEDVFLRTATGTWFPTGGPAPDRWQAVVALDPLRERIDRIVTRDPAVHGQVIARRGIRSSRSRFAQTRVPVDAVLRLLREGASTDQVLEAYPDLTQADLDAVRSLTVVV